MQILFKASFSKGKGKDKGKDKGNCTTFQNAVEEYPLWFYTYVQACLNTTVKWQQIIVVCPNFDKTNFFQQQYNSLIESLDPQIVLNYLTKPSFLAGGSSRQESVFKALSFLKNTQVGISPSIKKPLFKNEAKPLYDGELGSFSKDIVYIHDAARPFIDKKDWANLQSDESIRLILNNHCLLLGNFITDTLYQIADNSRSSQLVNNFTEEYNYILCQKNLDRTKIIKAFTPQVALFEIIYKLHYQASTSNNGITSAVFPAVSVTDDAGLFIKNGLQVLFIPSKWAGLKLTYPEDVQFAKFLIEQNIFPDSTK